MKKIIIIIILITILSSSLPGAHAQNGGYYFYTDIKTYLNNAPITAYNIGGKTMIDAEILNWHYGYDVYWRPKERLLEITDKGGRFASLQALAGGLVESNSGKVGSVAGRYYGTDIVTTLNGRPIESYNIGGSTCILAESMLNFGYLVDWSSNERTLRIYKPLDFYKHESDFGIINSIYSNKYDGLAVKVIDNPFDTGNLEISIIDSYVPFVPLKPVLDAMGASYYLDEQTKTFIDTYPDGKEDKYENYTYSLLIENKDLKLKQKESPYEYPADALPEKYERLDLYIDIFVNGNPLDTTIEIFGKQIQYSPYLHDGVLYLPLATIYKIFQ